MYYIKYSSKTIYLRSIIVNGAHIGQKQDKKERKIPQIGSKQGKMEGN